MRNSCRALILFRQIVDVVVTMANFAWQDHAKGDVAGYNLIY